MTGRFRWVLVFLSGAVLLLGAFAGSRPDLIAQWTRTEQPRPRTEPAAVSGKGEPRLTPAQPTAANAPEDDVVFPPADDSRRTTVRFAIDRNPSGAIEGRVTDRGGRPDPGRMVCVSAMQGEGTRVATDAGGRYRKEGLIPGLYLVALDPSAGGGSAGGEAAVLVEVRSSESSTADFLVHEAGRLEGRILREGEPAVGAEVRVLQVMTGPGRRERAAATAADDEGRFVLEGLEPGSYRIIATHERARRVPDGVIMAGLARLETALEVHPGENRADLVFPAGGLLGKVVDAGTGAPLALALVTVLPAARSREPTGFYERYASLEAGAQMTGEDGGFQLEGLTPGNYRVVASLAGYRQHAELVSVTGGSTPCVIPLQPGGGTVEVELIIPEGVFLPLLNLRVTDSQGYDLGYYPMGGNDRDHSLFERTQQRLTHLAPGRHLLELEVPGQGRFTAEVAVSEERTPRVSFVLASQD